MLQQANFLALGAFVASLLGAATIFLGISMLTAPKREAKRRLAGLRERWQRGPVAEAAEASLSLRTGRDGGILDMIAAKILPRPDMLRQRLRRTGYPITLGQYLVVSLAAIIATFLIFDLWLRLPGATSFVVALAAGLWIPHLWVSWLIARRAAKFIALFPESIDLIVRGLRSGLPVAESITAVGREVEDPVGQEFRRISDMVALGKTLDDALAEVAKIVSTPEFNFFVVSLSIQQETGGNLAETLENLADILRRRHQLKLKIRAMSSEARASALIIGSLPFVMAGIIYLVNANYLAPLFTDPRGITLVGVSLAIMGIGSFVIAKMVRFEI